jgi:hypothetical protein
MGLFDFFTGGTPAPAPAPQPTPGNIPPNTGMPANPTPGAAPNGTVPEQPAPPLADFQDLWKTEQDPNAVQQPEGIFANVDPKQFVEAASKINFTKQIAPEQLQAIAAGGEEAVKAFAAALNSVGQNAYAQSSFAATKMIEAALAKSKDNFMKELPQHIKSETVAATLKDSNPLFNNPATQPILAGLQQQLTVKFPQASPKEIADMAQKYLTQFASAIQPQQPTQATSKSGKPVKETDWSSFLN